MNRQHISSIKGNCLYPHSFFLVFLFIFMFASFSFSQTGAALKLFQKHVRLTGQMSSYGELYHVQGTSRRRPPSTGRIALTPTLTFTKNFSVSTNILLSTEGSYARQNMNIIGLHPAWTWGRAHIGDYSGNYSNQTFNGVRVKGGGVEIFPGRFRFAAGGGQTRRAVEAKGAGQSFAQYLFTSRIGYKIPNGSYFDMIFLKVKDDPNSISREALEYEEDILPDTMRTELDTLWVDRPYRSLSLTPQENVIAGFAGQLYLMKRRVILRFEGSASAYTKDTYAEALDIDSLGVPGALKEVMETVFVPRRGTNVDYIAETDLQINGSGWKTRLKYRNIGPGYISLGTPSTINDRRDLSLSTSFKISRNQVQLSWSRLTDNLLGQKQATNTRNQLRSALQTQTDRWRSQIRIDWLTMNNDAKVDSLGWGYDNWIFSTHQSLIFNRDASVRNIGLLYTLQTSNKETHTQKIRSWYHTINLTGQFRLTQNIRLNTSVGFTHRDSQTQSAYTTQVYTIRLQQLAFQNRLSVSLFSISSMVRDTRTFRNGISAGYRLTNKNQVTFKISHNLFRGTSHFEELRASLNLSHRL